MSAASERCPVLWLVNQGISKVSQIIAAVTVPTSCQTDCQVQITKADPDGKVIPLDWGI